MLMEVTIVALVFAKVKVPLLHSLATLMRLMVTGTHVYDRATLLFICVLLDKKHALQYKGLDVLIFHFI
jgi:hypothetical protein